MNDNVHVNVHDNVDVNDYRAAHTIIFSSLVCSYLFLNTPPKRVEN